MSVQSVNEFLRDPEALAYLSELRDEIFECLATFLVALLERPNTDAKMEFTKYLDQICNFFEQTLLLEGFSD